MRVVDYRAELSAIATALGITAATGWAGRLAALEPWLAGYLEYQLRLDEPALSVVTLGKDEAFLDQVRANLMSAGASAVVLEAFEDLVRRVQRATWGLKLSLVDPGDVQVYLKKPVPLDVVGAWLLARGITADAVALLERVSRDLDRSHTHFVGLDASPEPILPLQIYFTQYTDDPAAVQERVGQVARRLGLSGATCDEISASIQRLAGEERTLWVSLTLINGRFLPALKLDFSSPPQEEVLQLIPPSQRARLYALAGAVSARGADYVGLRFAGDGPARASLYLTRKG
jgi:hypothetical protein